MLEKDSLSNQPQMERGERAAEGPLKLEQWIDLLPMGVAQIDPRNRCLLANAPFKAMWMDGGEGRVCGESLEERMAGSTFQALRPYLEAVWGGNPQTFELTLAERGHKEHEVTIRLVPYSYEEGRVATCLMIVEDITERKEIKRKLALQSTALEAAANGMVITDQRGMILWANPAITGMTGYALEELHGRNPRILKSGKHDRAFYRELWSTISAGRIWQGEVTNRRKDGSFYVEEMTITPVRNGGGREITHYIAIKQDVTARKQVEEALQKSEKRYRMVVENQGEGTAILDVTLNFEYINLAGENILGIAAEKIIGKNLRDFLPEDQKTILKTQLQNRIEGKTSTYEMDLLRTDENKRTVLITATPRFNTAGEFSGSFAVFRDISERKAMEMKLRYQSAHDVLTGLYNRLYFEEEIKRLENSRIVPISIIVLDVDNLKAINDSGGHLVGDELLRSAARILKESFRAEDVVARIGGDEFAVVLPQTSATELEKSMGRLKENLWKANQSRGTRPINLSMGGATSEGDEALTEAFKRADAEMYTDKNTRKAHGRVGA